MFKDDHIKKVEEEKKKLRDDLSKILCETPERQPRFTTVSDMEIKDLYTPDDIKDIDSAIEAVREKAYYIGNVVLGNSQQAKITNRCINSSFIYKTQDVYDCKFVAYSSILRFAEYIFGGNAIGEGSKYNIKTFETYKNVRCMETIRNYVASDCYFTGSLESCSNCMFSFNQRNKHNMIGNCQVSQDEYLKLKEKLIEDIRETLKQKKYIPSLIDIINGDDN